MTIEYGYLSIDDEPRVSLGQDFALLDTEYTAVWVIQRYLYIKVLEGSPFLRWVVDIRI